jgi:hypothetical protein
MALPTPTPITITVKQPIGRPLGQTMNEIRSWLDSKKIEPASFKPIVAGGGILFEIGFRSHHEAELFQQNFV